MTPPSKFTLMRSNRRRTNERLLREKIKREAAEEMATWRPLKAEDFPATPSLPSGMRRWWWPL